MITLFVTGGAGFIGSNFVRRVLSASPDLPWKAAREADGLRLVVLDALTYAGNLDSLRDVAEDPRFVFERVDIADRASVREAFGRYRPQAVVNFAAESHVDRSIDDASAFIRTNVTGAFELLEATRHYLAQDLARDLAERDEEEKASFRFVHVSTDEVYGSLGPTGLFTETSTYAPNSPYAASKASADLLVRSYFKTYGLPALVTNCSNNYGPYQFPEKLIPLMVLNALEGKDLPIYGDGSNVRDWIYVEDHCDGVLAALEKGKPGEKYNFGGSAERSNLEVVRSICAALEELHPAAENPALVERGLSSYGELETFVQDRPGHDWRYAIDDSKARRDLGWAPRKSFAEGLALTVRWYLDHPEWCRRVQDGSYQRQRLGHLQPAAAEGAKP